MSDIKHTPGPWHPVEYAGYWMLHKNPFYGQPDLLNEDSVFGEVAKYNARLAAASPELLDTLLSIKNAMIWGNNPSDKGLIEMAEEAIKKATGE